MNKLWLLLFALPAFAQSPVIGGAVSYVGTAPSGSCAQAPPVQVLNAGGYLYTCNNGTWTQQTSGGGGGGATSVSNSDGTLTISPTTGAVVGSIALGHVNTWTGAQTFPTGSAGVTQSTGDNSTKLATDAFVQSALAPALQGSIQAEYVAYLDGSGTTLHDQSGNGFNCTFSTGGSAPTWNLLGNGIQISYPTTGLSYLICPAGTLSGAQTIQVFVAPSNPLTSDPLTSFDESYLMEDGSGNAIGMTNSRNGVFSLLGSIAEVVTPIDRAQGNVDWAISCTTPSTIYTNGVAAQGYLVSANCPTFATTGTVYLGTAAAQAGFQWSGTIYAVLVYSSVLTAAQINNNHLYMAQQLALHGVTSFGNPTPQNMVLYEGDSRIAGLGSLYQMTQSRQFYIASITPETSQFWNEGVSGETIATIVGSTHLKNVEYPLLTTFPSISKTILLDAGINDISGGASAATVYANVQSFCSTMHSIAPGTKVVYSTSIIDSGYTSVKELIREALNGDAISGFIAGTFNCDGVDDIANDPIMATQAVPNVYNSSGSSSFNTTWYASGIHETPAANKEISTQESFAILAAQGRASKCTVIRKQIPYLVPVAANTASAGLTQSVTLLQLFPNWQVCSLTSTVKTAFTGTATLTMSIGDSTGTATQYQTAQTLTSTGAVTQSPNTYVSTNGIVQMNFIATVSNLTSLSAGEVDIDIGVVVLP